MMHAAGVAMVLPEKGAANEKLDAKLPWMLRLRVTGQFKAVVVCIGAQVMIASMFSAVQNYAEASAAERSAKCTT